MKPELEKPILEVDNVSKRFPGVLALDDVGMKLFPGEILAVIGENGAGKSTLMKMLGGIYQADTGKILLDDTLAIISSPATATKLGIALIHQELNLSENLDIAANIFLGREPHRMGPLRILDKKTMYRQSQEILNRLGITRSPKTIVKNLAIGEKQLVEIAKALSVNARILILDEPTSSLSQKETGRLFNVIKELKAKQVSIIYISHRLAEVKQIADRVVALRDGRNSGQLTRNQISHDQMVKLMVGRDIDKYYHHRRHATSKTVLEVENLVMKSSPSNKISLTVGAGEIVGIAGLVGAGRTELAQTLFGIDKPLAGSVKVNGKRVHITTPSQAIEVGIVLVPEDRKQHGLIAQMNVQENITLAGLNKYQRMKFIKNKIITDVAKKMVKKLDIRTPSLNHKLQTLSGGNQQKVVLGKWLSLKAHVLILDEPTRGIDVISKEEIYRLMEKLASEGMAILMISSEMEELLAISDRVIVMHEGEITGKLSKDEITEQSVMELATGGMK